MKTFKLILFISLSSLVFVSCKDAVEELKTTNTLVTFEDVVLPSSGFWNGSDLSGKPVKELPSWGGTDSITNYYGSCISNNMIFKNSFIPDPLYPSWAGFSVSLKADTLTSGYINQYSVMAGIGALNSKQFALAYDSASLVCPENTNGNFSIKSIMLTNSTYSYLYLKPAVKDSWFKVLITGYLNKKEKSTVEYYLADFRNGKNFLSKIWNKVDLSSLGEVDQLAFTFESSDLFCPSYVCIDNIEFTQTISTK